MRQQTKNTLKRIVFRLYRMGTRLGVHVAPVHHYSPLPNIIELERTKDVWAKKSDLPGLDIDLDRQVQTLREFCLPHREEFTEQRFGPGDGPVEAHYGYIEALVLHGVIRHLKPRRIIEVGCGMSTRCMLTAIGMNAEEGGTETSMTCIEPYPKDWLRECAQISLVDELVQRVPVERFTELDDGDFLFIDSSHTVKPGGDVNYLVLEVLPRLRPGVVVHFHDITLPYDYQANVLKTFLHWSETSLLRAFLCGNAHAEILFCLSHLHYERQADLLALFPRYQPISNPGGLREPGHRPFARRPQHFPSSIYFRIR